MALSEIVDPRGDMKGILMAERLRSRAAAPMGPPLPASEAELY
jgi:hypothetical protein